MSGLERNLDPRGIIRCAIDLLKKDIKVNYYRFIEQTDHSSDDNHGCFINSMEVHEKHPSFWTKVEAAICLFPVEYSLE